MVIIIKNEIQKYFTDLIYSCIMILRSKQPTDEVYTNSTFKTIRKVGILRVRAIELLKTLIVLQNRASIILKQKIIDTVLYMIKTFPFCCITH